MKTIDAQSAVPTMQNSFVEYNGSLDNSSGALSDGTSSVVPIATEIRQNLSVVAVAEEALGGTRRVFDCYWTQAVVANGVITVTIEVPSGCICTYRICGNKELTEPYSQEQGTGVGTVGNQHAGGHRHDGNDSHTVSYNDLTDTPTIPTGLPFLVEATFNLNGAPATYGYDTNFGEDGVNFYPPNSPATLKIVAITYNTNDGAGNYNVGGSSMVSTIGGDTVASTDRFAFRFWDNGGTDTIAIYKNGSLYKNLTTLFSTPQPAFGNSTYKLILQYSESPF